jgi:hypothetical protein
MSPWLAERLGSRRYSPRGIDGLAFQRSSSRAERSRRTVKVRRMAE